MEKDQYYLNCEYSPMGENYSVKFRPYKKESGNHYCIVKKEDVLVADSSKNGGLVRILLVSVKKNKALIGINDVRYRQLRFHVQKKDVSKNQSAADHFRNNLVAAETAKNPFAMAEAEKYSKHIIH